MLPRNEDNTDREDALRISQLRPVSTIAIQDQTAREKASQTLVDNAIQDEQRNISVHPILQEVRGEPGGYVDNVKNIVSSIPTTMMNPVKVVPNRTTISGVMKERMGVANIRARTKIGAVPPTLPLKAKVYIYPKDENAFGTEVKEKTVLNTPVRSLNFIDQFFNWLNALLS